MVLEVQQQAHVLEGVHEVDASSLDEDAEENLNDDDSGKAPFQEG